MLFLFHFIFSFLQTSERRYHETLPIPPISVNAAFISLAMLMTPAGLKYNTYFR